VLAAADSGNGVSATLDYHDHVFINTDLTVQLVREPAGEWVCLDAITRVGPDGVGLAESVLSDERGRLGSATQTLLVRRR
jgi:acyl-Coa thioesterase superfamily protein